MTPCRVLSKLASGIFGNIALWRFPTVSRGCYHVRRSCLGSVVCFDGSQRLSQVLAFADARFVSFLLSLTFVFDALAIADVRL